MTVSFSQVLLVDMPANLLVLCVRQIPVYVGVALL